MVVWALVSAVAPMLLVLSFGSTLARVPPAVNAGWSSPAGHALQRAVLLLGAIFFVSVAVSGLRTALGTIVKVRLTYKMQQRLMTAVSAPTTIRHLEDPGTLDRVALAQGSLMTYFPADAPMFLADVFVYRAMGFLACLLVGTFRWWLAVLLIAFNLAIHPVFERIQNKQVALFGGNGGIMRRAFYFNSLATRPDAGKEIRVFGLGGWVVDQLTRHWQDGMEPAWDNLADLRRGAARVYGMLAVVYLGVLLYLAREAYEGHVSPARAAVVVGALSLTVTLGAMSHSSVSLTWSMSAIPHLDTLEASLLERPLPPGGCATGLPTRDVHF